jgi:hypothetical protein
MSTDPSIQAMRYVFLPWRNAAANLPPLSMLREQLEGMITPHHNSKAFEVQLTPTQSKYFASASIEIWHRAVHSLLVSTALTRESILWSCISGYYATHYTFRAFAHAMGYFQLFQERWTISLRMESGSLVGTFRKGRKREHEWYRSVISELPCLNSDPFFAPTERGVMIDSTHRDHANYSDHFGLPPNIQNIDREAIRNRMQQLARMEVQTPLEFSFETFPDIGAVQVNAYQRVARFRRFLDETLENNRLWDVLRTPGWATYFTDFQFIEPRGAVQR